MHCVDFKILDTYTIETHVHLNIQRDSQVTRFLGSMLSGGSRGRVPGFGTFPFFGGPMHLNGDLLLKLPLSLGCGPPLLQIAESDPDAILKQECGRGFALRPSPTKTCKFVFAVFPVRKRGIKIAKNDRNNLST